MKSPYSEMMTSFPVGDNGESPLQVKGPLLQDMLSLSMPGAFGQVTEHFWPLFSH